jgi:hypothetical protein
VIPDPVLSHDPHPSTPKITKAPDLLAQEANTLQEGEVADGRSIG